MESQCPMESECPSKQTCWPPSRRRSGFPPGPWPTAVAASSEAVPRILVVLDDDPTGTQSVADLPVLTRWDVADFAWAFDHATAAARTRSTS